MTGWGHLHTLDIRGCMHTAICLCTHMHVHVHTNCTQTVNYMCVCTHVLLKILEGDIKVVEGEGGLRVKFTPHMCTYTHICRGSQ